eukprot:scaffold237886_cov33-Tisochrysis_lutea.AAC.2
MAHATRAKPNWACTHKSRHSHQYRFTHQLCDPRQFLLSFTNHLVHATLFQHHGMVARHCVLFGAY